MNRALQWVPMKKLPKTPEIDSLRFSFQFSFEVTVEFECARKGGRKKGRIEKRADFHFFKIGQKDRINFFR